MKLELFKEAVITRDIPEEHIEKGDLVMVIDYLDDPEPGYMLEIFDALGKSISVVSVPEADVESLHDGERLQVRLVEA
jgi:hypothetical protein